MSEVYIVGTGAVSPAGWGVQPLQDAVAKDQPLAVQLLQRPGQATPLRVMRVPAPSSRPAFLSHSRLRRTSPITQFAVAASAEALTGHDADRLDELGVIVCVFSGCVNYSRRFYDETLKNPATASPLVFPETVFNAPGSHIAAFFGTTAVNYTLVGDAGTFLLGMALGGQWLLEGRVEKCLVVGTEEMDWLTSDALRLFDRNACMSEGAGAVLLSKNPNGACGRLSYITDEFLYTTSSKREALGRMRAALGQRHSRIVLCDSTSGQRGISREENELWRDWKDHRISPRRVLGEGLMAAAAWQTVLAADLLKQKAAEEVLISVCGFHQHAIGAVLKES